MKQQILSSTRTGCEKVKSHWGVQMYFKCEDVETSEIVFIDTESELEVGNVFHFKGRALAVVKKIDPRSEEAQRIPCSDLKKNTQCKIGTRCFSWPHTDCTSKRV